MRLSLSFLAVLCLSVSEASRLRSTTTRKLAQWHSNDYYWTLSGLMLYFDGNCYITPSSAKCSNDGYTAELVGKGSHPPTAQQLKTCQLGAGSSKCNTYYYNGSMNANQIMAQALPGMSKFETVSYREVLYDMLLNYAGPNCSLRVNNSSQTVSKCSIGGSQATLTGTGSGPSPQSLEKCTIVGGGNTKCQTWNFTSKTNVKDVCSQAFPGLN